MLKDGCCLAATNTYAGQPGYSAGAGHSAAAQVGGGEGQAPSPDCGTLPGAQVDDELL